MDEKHQPRTRCGSYSTLAWTVRLSQDPSSMGVTSVRKLEAETGGVRPRPRKRSKRSLSLEEREMPRGVAEGLSIAGDRDGARSGNVDDLT